MPANKSNVVDFQQVLQAEHAAVNERRKMLGRKDHDSTTPKDICGLAISGGGIRSATFGLGVIQGLAQIGLLDRFDYLSTVSGGGYIGSWLSTWIHEDGLKKVTEGLNPAAQRGASAQIEGLPKEPSQIRHLRYYSRYLAPSTSWLSLDGWVLVAIYLRNLLLNMLVILLATLALFTAIRGFVEIYSLLYDYTDSSSWTFWIEGIIALCVITTCIVTWAVWLVPLDGGSGTKLSRSSTYFKIFVWHWRFWTIAAFCDSLLFADRNATFWLRFDNVYAWMAMMLIPGVIYGFSGVCLLVRKWNEISVGSGWARIWNVLFGLLALGIGAFIAGAAGGASLFVFMKIILSESGNAPVAAIATFGTPAVLASFTIANFIQVGLMNQSCKVYEREWWSSLNASLLRAAIVWLLVASISIYAPWILALSMSSSWGIGIGSLLSGGWLGTTFAAIRAGKSAETGGLREKTFQALLAKAGPTIFLFGLLVAISFGATIIFYEIYADRFHHDEWRMLARSTSVLADLNTAKQNLPLPLLRNREIPAAVALWCGTAICLLLSYCLALPIGVNRFSMHELYRNRLVRCYLGIKPDRRPNPVTNFDANDDYPLHSLHSDVEFSANGTNEAKSTSATFSRAGDYIFQVTIADASGLSTTTSVTVKVNQTIERIVVRPLSAKLAGDQKQQFTATALDQFGRPLANQPAFAWSNLGVGNVDSNGLYTSLNVPGAAVVSAKCDAITGAAYINKQAPKVATAAAATPVSVDGTTTILSVLGQDDGGEPTLRYTWAATSGPAEVSYSRNGANEAKNTVATFSQAGIYTFQVTITNSCGLSSNSIVVPITVNQIRTSIAVSPYTATLAGNQTQQFKATELDQFGQPMAVQPTFEWTNKGCGDIDGNGLYTSPNVLDRDTIRASNGTMASTAYVNKRAPTVSTAAASIQMNYTTTELSAIGQDDGGEANLKYTWAAMSGPAAVSYSRNGTNEAKKTAATFSRAGDYTFQVTITDAGGLSTTSDAVSVSREPILTSITVSPSTAMPAGNQTQQFTATALDQFGQPMAVQPPFKWANTGVGTIDGNGLYRSPGVVDAATVMASREAITGKACVNKKPPRVEPDAMTTRYTNRTTMVLSVLGADDGGENNLTYTWAVTDAPLDGKQTPRGAKLRGPIHLINTALNRHVGQVLGDNDEQTLGFLDRKAESFVFSPLYCGSESTGYLDSAVYKPVVRIGTAMTISGAAVSPNMGFHSSPAVAALLTAFNVRLGAWLPNPKFCRNADSVFSDASWFLLFKEVFGIPSAHSEFVYLSDGGHFENLGVYELFRRGCRFIVVIDGGADPKFLRENIGALVRTARIDFGVRIDLDVSDTCPDANGLCKSHVAVGRIFYDNKTVPDVTGKSAGSDGLNDLAENHGIIVYLKAGLTGDEAPDILNYHAVSPDFPNETTFEQFYSEAQFESYRALGVHTVFDLFDDVPMIEKSASSGLLPKIRHIFDPYDERAAAKLKDDSSTADIFKSLHGFWLSMPEGFLEKFLELNGIYAAINEKLRNDDDLVRLAKQIYYGGHDDVSPPTLKERLMVNEMMALLENVFLALRINEFGKHPLCECWHTVFKQWTGCGIFRELWGSVRNEYNPALQNYIEKRQQVKTKESP